MASILDVYGHGFSVWVGHCHLRLHDLDPGNMESVASQTPETLAFRHGFVALIYGNSQYMEIP